MFNNIPFRKIHPSQLQKDNYIPECWYSQEDYNNVSDLSLFTAGMEADYVISGTVFLLPLRPVSQYAMKNYLYLQSFGVLHSDEKYYTKRKDYDSYMVLYTISGSGYFEYEGKEYYLKKGEGFFIDCRKPHYYRTEGKSWQHSVFHFNGNIACTLYNTFKNKNSVILNSSTTQRYNSNLTKLLNIYNECPMNMELQISNELYNIFTDLITMNSIESKKESPVEETIKTLMKYIESNYHKKISLDDMVKLTNISKYHLSREFKRLIGFSPNEYIIRIRIEQAKQLLHNTYIPINKIGLIVGIHDPNNFTYLFKKYEGTTPGKFRAFYT